MMPTRSVATSAAAVRATCAARLDVIEDLTRFDEERGAGRGQVDVVGAAVQQSHVQLAFQPLDLLTQRRLHDVLPGGRRPKCSSSASVTK